MRECCVVRIVTGFPVCGRKPNYTGAKQEQGSWQIPGTIRKEQTMKTRMRKSLGILLSLIMVLTSISVAFVVSAAPIDDLRDALARIPDAELATAFTQTASFANTATGNQVVRITDNTSNGSVVYAFNAYAAWLASVRNTTAASRNVNTAITWWTKAYAALTGNS